MKLRLAVVPKFCGPISVGTLGLIKLIHHQGKFSITEAKSFVDDAVFGGKIVDIPLPDEINGQELLEEILTLESPAKITAELIANGETA